MKTVDNSIVTSPSSNHQSNLRLFADAAPAGRRIIKHHKPSPASRRGAYKQARNEDRRIRYSPSSNHRSNLRLHAGSRCSKRLLALARIIKHHKPSPASRRGAYKQARNEDRRIR